MKISYVVTITFQQWPIAMFKLLRRELPMIIDNYRDLLLGILFITLGGDSYNYKGEHKEKRNSLRCPAEANENITDNDCH